MASSRVATLRQLLKANNLHAYLVPEVDAHQSEYLAACDTRRSFMSGFTGSAGYAVVTLDKAALWTDGRYFLQAEKQLDASLWTLMKSGQEGVVEKEVWLCDVLPLNSRVGMDPHLITIDQAKTLRTALQARGHTLVATHGENLVDQVWAKDRPTRPQNPVVSLALKYAGQSHVEKLSNLQQFLKDYGATKPATPTLTRSTDAIHGGSGAAGIVVCALDEIAWLFNLRGSDIRYNPVFFAYAIVTTTETFLYVDSRKLNDDVVEHLAAANVHVRPYLDFYVDLASARKTLHLSKEGKKLLYSSTCNFAVQEALGNTRESTSNDVEDLLESVALSPIVAAKSIKNATELEGFRQCHLRDGAALCNYFGWLKHQIVVLGNGAKLTEVDVADKCEHFRRFFQTKVKPLISREQADFVGLSFDTISSVGANAAIIHYKPERPKCAVLDRNQIYLCDSGGQFRDGTTDVTRTLHFGSPNEFEREAFTRVLQGHIAIDRAVFPAGTTGYQLDLLARTALWKIGLDYRHGTGHGVGSFLNVHEGPHGIAARIQCNTHPLKAGMTVTDEPGYYHDGAFGIRIENVLLVKRLRLAHEFDGKHYLGFEHVTIVPLGQSLMQVSLMSAEEIQWINAYHRECREKLAPLLDSSSLGYQWMMKETEGLS